ncbi:UNVERIFIED_CONTAM: hypothetical protein Cloal_0929 [Acetivibrio alkalicellulosi]
MDNLLVYKTWAPEESPWSLWVKPVLFAFMTLHDYTSNDKPSLEPLKWASSLNKSTAVILDLPGGDGILQGLSFAVHNGYRPIPLYNCCKGHNMIIDVSCITSLLNVGGTIISESNLASDAPPVFILDSRRLEHGYDSNAGKFDNRWCIVPQDMPSANFLKNAGIDTIILRTDKVNGDLAHILVRYQKSNINIKICRNDELVQDVNLKEPSSFRSIFYRSSVFFGLKRNSAGGFGAIVPEINHSSNTYSSSRSRMG